MTEPTIGEMTERLRRLERQGRAFRLAVVIAILGLIGQTAYDHFRLHDARTIAAENFAVRNARGEVVALLGVGPNGQPSLALSDASGRVRAAINLAPSGTPSIMLADADKTVRAGIALRDDGSPLVMPGKAP